MVGQASALGFDSLAITDHGALYGAVAFYQACEAKEIKSIIGVETYVARRTMRDRDGKLDDKPYHLVLLAQGLDRYQNLCRLVRGCPPRGVLLQAAHRQGATSPGTARG